MIDLLQRSSLERTLESVAGVLGGDAELWSAARTGDGDAFSRLFALHRDRVFRHAARMVDSAAEADDVAASAFFELWRKRGSVTLVDGSPLPWLLVVTTNLARNTRRGTARYRAVLDRLPRSLDLEDPADRALERVEHQRGESAVHVAMRQLSPADLNLLVLTALEGLTAQEASAALGLKEGTARSRLSRARARLRTTLTGAHASSLELMREEP
jgi:RNA polymerase sigma factor (sigma-70 family)